METICDDLYVGENWKLSQDDDKSLVWRFYNEDTSQYEVLSVQQPPKPKTKSDDTA